MAEVSGRALVVLVQLLDEKLWALKARIDRSPADDPDLSEVEEELAANSAVADELRASYEAAARSTGNLPPYGSLVRFGSLQGGQAKTP